jgi:hypothetical protein
LATQPLDRDETGQALLMELFRVLASAQDIEGCAGPVDPTLLSEAIVSLLVQCGQSAADVLTAFLEADLTIGIKVQVLSIMSQAATRLANLSGTTQFGPNATAEAGTTCSLY